MKSRTIIPALLVSCGLALSGCEGGTIFNTFELTNDESVTTGARQRAILNIPVGPGSVPGQVNPNRIVCAEPSPDVALAVANSFGLGVSIVSQGSGSVSASQAEGIAQLAERVATIQLLRDGLYRACEAYANGAISSTEYSVIVSGVDDTMVTLLLGELAASAFGRASAALGTAASAAAGSGIDSNKALENAVAASDDLKGKQKQLDAETVKLENLKKAKPDAPDQTAAQKKIDAQNKKVEEAEKERDKAKDRYELALTVFAGAGGTATMSAAEIKELRALGAITAKASPKLAAEIRMMQKNFLERSKTDALMIACISELSRSPLIPSSEKSAKTLGTAFGNLAKKLRDWEKARKGYLGNSTKETKSVLMRAESALLTAVQRADVSSLAYKCMTVMDKVLEAQKKQAKNRYKIAKLRLRLDAQKEKDGSQAIAEFARLCRIEAPTNEQKAACTVLTKVYAKMTSTPTAGANSRPKKAPVKNKTVNPPKAKPTETPGGDSAPPAPTPQ